jgi:hypothetical protein
MVRRNPCPLPQPARPIEFRSRKKPNRNVQCLALEASKPELNIKQGLTAFEDWCASTLQLTFFTFFEPQTIP